MQILERIEPALPSTGQVLTHYFFFAAFEGVAR